MMSIQAKQFMPNIIFSLGYLVLHTALEESQWRMSFVKINLVQAGDDGTIRNE